MAPGASPTTDRESFHTRVVAATPAQLFAAVADPARLARWWGPNGFSSTFRVFEFRPGGRWIFTLHGPDGADYPNENLFAEIAPPGRVVVEHLSDTHHFMLTITFEAGGSGTRVGWRQVFDDAAHLDEVAAVISAANEENLDRLEAEVLGVGPQ